MKTRRALQRARTFKLNFVCLFVGDEIVDFIFSLMELLDCVIYSLLRRCCCLTAASFGGFRKPTVDSRLAASELAEDAAAFRSTD